jgi:uncharacterized membrane protein
MADLMMSVDVAAAPQRVFAIASDIEGSPKMQPKILSVEMLTPGPMRTGTKWREKRKMGSGHAEAMIEVTGFEPGKRYEFASMSKGPGFTGEIAVAPKGSGTVLSMTMRTMGLGSKIMLWMMGGMLKKELMDDLQCIKRAAEA